MPKTWLEKYNSTKPSIVKVIDKRFADLAEGTKMFIATPKIIDNYVKEIPRGASVDVKIMRKDLAIEHFAENSCPVTTSIFLRIVAEVALESLSKGKTTNDITPFWRVVHPKTPLAKKLSCGVEFIKEQRSKENING